MRVFRIQLPVSILKEGERYIAYTPALDLSTSGRSQKEVKKRFGEAVEIFFEELVEAGTLDDALATLGWRKVKRQWTPPKVVSQRSETVRIPVPT